MAVIELSPRYVNPLEALAKQQQASVETIVEELIDRFLREHRHASLVQEMEHFREQHAQLLGQFRGQFIGMLHGQVVDSDPDGGALHTRLARRYGDQPVLIVEVTEQPEQEFRSLNRRLVL